MTKFPRRIWMAQLPSPSLASRKLFNKAFDTKSHFITEDEPALGPLDLIVCVDSSPKRNISTIGGLATFSPSVEGGNIEAFFEYEPIVLKNPIPFSTVAKTAAFRSAPFVRSFSGRSLYLLSAKQAALLRSAIAKSDATAASFLARHAEMRNPRGKANSPHEGKKAWRQHLHIERARGLPGEKKLAVYGRKGELKCEVCDFDFAKFYDIPGLEFLCEAHHLQPLATLKNPKATSLSDLALVCANCHAVLHYLDPIPSIRELRKFVRQRFTGLKTKRPAR